MQVTRTLRKRVIRRLQYMADWRCTEPVVVFESDDWGMHRRACSGFVSQFGKPGEWADEVSETPADLDALFHVLKEHVDPIGRPASLTANFVVGNPDFDAIEPDGFNRYYDQPISNELKLVHSWKSGVRHQVFC